MSVCVCVCATVTYVPLLYVYIRLLRWLAGMDKGYLVHPDLVCVAVLAMEVMI